MHALHSMFACLLLMSRRIVSSHAYSLIEANRHAIHMTAHTPNDGDGHGVGLGGSMSQLQSSVFGPGSAMIDTLHPSTAACKSTLHDPTTHRPTVRLITRALTPMAIISPPRPGVVRVSTYFATDDRGVLNSIDVKLLGHTGREVEVQMTDAACAWTRLGPSNPLVCPRLCLCLCFLLLTPRGVPIGSCLSLPQTLGSCITLSRPV